MNPISCNKNHSPRRLKRRVASAIRLIILSMVSFVCSSVQAEMITTLFAANNRQAGNMFNIDVIATDGIRIEEFDLNLLVGTWDINVYTLDGSYVGNETNLAAWTLHDSISGLASAGPDNPTSWDVSDLYVAAGNQAFYFEVTNGAAMLYTNGTTEGSLVADDGNVQIFEGTGNAVNFGTVFRPRVWNGTIHFMVVPEPYGLLILSGLVSLVAMRRRRR